MTLVRQQRVEVELCAALGLDVSVCRRSRLPMSAALHSSALGHCQTAPKKKTLQQRFLKVASRGGVVFTLSACLFFRMLPWLWSSKAKASFELCKLHCDGYAQQVPH